MTGPFEERLANGIISINGRFNDGKKKMVNGPFISQMAE